MSIISCTSPSPSAMILPDSSVTSWPSSDFNSRRALPSCRTVSPRTGPGVIRHFSKAARARSMVVSYSESVAVRTWARSLPSIGENFSMTGPQPSHSPQKTPGFSSAIPRVLNNAVVSIQFQAGSPTPATTLVAGLLALGPQQTNRFVDYFSGDVQSRAKTNGMIARFEHEKTAIEQTLPEFVARPGIGQVEGKEEPATSHGGNNRLFALQLPEALEEVLTDDARVLDQVFLLDDAKEMGRANHIGVVPAPGGVQAA